MDMKEFLQQYNNNLLEALEDKTIGVSYIAIECRMCPLQKQCGEDAEKEECGGYVNCADYIKSKLSDGQKYKA